VPLTSGSLTNLGSVSGVANGTTFTGAAFDANGLLLGTANGGNLYRINIATRAATLIGNSGGTLGDLASVPGLPNLAIAKSHTGNFQLGQQHAYTISVSNVGTAVTTAGGAQIVVTDTLPTGLAYVSASGTGWTCSAIGAVITCNRPTTDVVNAGAALPNVTLTVTVSLAAPTSVTNTARVVGGGDQTSGNNAASDPTTINVPGASVSPDGGQNLVQLPSNGVNYTFSFTVTNTGSGSGAFGLKVFPRLGAAVTIISVNGVVGDSANATIAAGSALVVPVVYSVGNVASGVADSIYLRARSASVLTVSDTGFADLTVVRPRLTTSKTVAASGAILPGTELTYLVSFANAGSAAASSVVLVDSLPPAVQFRPGSVVSTPPAGVSVAVDYSSDLGLSWTYVPVSGGCGAPTGYDRCVNRIRWRLLSTLSATPPNHAGSVGFVAQIR
jgi:uncharacterized repeat protein (TIGR01451 family)